MTVAVDASIALKWVIEEDGSEEAGALLLEETLAAPDLLMIECANVLWAKARRGALTRDLARSGGAPGDPCRAASSGRLRRCRSGHSLRSRSDRL